MNEMIKPAKNRGQIGSVRVIPSIVVRYSRGSSEDAYLMPLNIKNTVCGLLDIILMTLMKL
jgi:hypothetical protein